MIYEAQYEVRDELIDRVRKELLGPGSEPGCIDPEHEVISAPPNKRYCIGVLYPPNVMLKREDDDVSSEYGKEEILNPDEETDFEANNSDRVREDTENKDKNTFHRPEMEDSIDEAIGMSNKILPSSMGFTFISSEKMNSLIVQIKFGTYEAAKIEDCKIIIDEKVENMTIPEVFADMYSYNKETRILSLKRKVEPSKDIKYWYDQGKADDGSFKNYAYKMAGLLSRGFKRIPHEYIAEINFDNGDYYNPTECLGETKIKICALRYKLSDQYYSYTIMIVNTDNQKSYASAENTVFQPSIRISSDKNEGLVFTDYSVMHGQSKDIEDLSNDLLYRKKKNYGTGLGTALNWNIDEAGKGWIETDFFPTVDVPQMEFSVDGKYHIKPETFSMKYLSDLNEDSKSNKINKLQDLEIAYSKWIDELNAVISSLPDQYHIVANQHMDNCRYCLERIKKGIQILRESKSAWDAFSLANRAMYMQRVHVALQNDEKYSEALPDNDDLADVIESMNYYDTEDNSSWRPFQLAFLLMSIGSITNDSSDNAERNTVDLIWFPTGGGKTEAYLGLTAMTIFYRKLTDLQKSNGTAVIMRYTLRLLASQQFTRASTLICACEIIRRESQKRRSLYPKYELGREPISIGLWIGGQHTPNKVKGTSAKDDNCAEYCSKQLNDAKVNNLDWIKDRYNKFQVLKCPWCGTKLVKEKTGSKMVGRWGYSVSNGHLKISCTQDGCPFEDGLPLQVVDSELYIHPPTLLFATVDKFAMLPWYADTGNFFAVKSNNRAPELIIQDELHLISGPLGSIVGLYESAVDKLCSMKGIKPKIIASTATICRAREQCSALYNREVFQFPPQGLDDSDSFFARTADLKEKPGRRYIGMIPAGVTKAMMESRLLAALLQFEQEIDAEPEVRDCYWTNTAYFNSIKELGKCSTIVQNDVRDNIRRLANKSVFVHGRRNILRADELTSRVSTTQLNQTLNKLEKIKYSEGDQTYPSNLLLATNMISVGIDVDRLNVMVLVGQPKLTSEYIQASSRVGRKYPGVVFTLYDCARSRDRSHYEMFKSYHESFYKNVEPTAVTPFSEPARQRALHAVVITLLRHGYGLSENEDISRFDLGKMRGILDELSEYLISRMEQINGRLAYEIESESDTVLKEIELVYEKIDHLANAAHHAKLIYGNPAGFAPPADYFRIMRPYDSESTDDFIFDTLTSMRNVDSGVNVNVIGLETVNE